MSDPGDCISAVYEHGVFKFEADALFDQLSKKDLRIRQLEAELERKDRQLDDLSTRLTQQTMRVRELTPIRARLQFYEHSRLGVRPEPLVLLIDDPSGDDVAPDATPEDRRRLNK